MAFCASCFGRHLDEGKAACATGFAIPHDVDGFDGADFAEQALQIVFVGRVWKVPDVQLTVHRSKLLHPLSDALVGYQSEPDCSARRAGESSPRI